MIDNSTYQYYDKIVAYTMQQIMEKSNNNNKIILKDLCPYDKAHLFILNICELTGGINNKSVYIDVGFFEYRNMKLNHIKRNATKRLGWKKYNELECIYVNQILNNIINHFNTNIIYLESIYDEYYNPEHKSVINGEEP